MGAGNSWAAASLERLLMKQIPGCEGYGYLTPLQYRRKRRGEQVGRGGREREKERNTPPWFSSLFNTYSNMEAGQLGGSRARPFGKTLTLPESQVGSYQTISLASVTPSGP